MNKLLPILLLFLLPLTVPAQNRVAEWYFGTGAGLRFDDERVSVISGALNSVEGCASICDIHGKLLFYTDGQTIFNAEHQEMQNGTGLLGHASSTQSAVILPKPGSSTIYYVFTTDQLGSVNGLRYSIVDMSLESGLGAVTSVKNIQLLSSCTEKLAAAKTSDCSGFWLIAHGVNNNIFYTYKLTDAGLNTSPVTSLSGTLHGTTTGDTRGFMKTSPDGKYLAVAVSSPGRFMELLQFNAATGVVSTQNVRRITYSNENPYGIEFAADNSKLYVSAGTSLYQYDLLAANDLEFNASQYQMYLTEPVYGMQLGPDEKIYLAKNSGFLDVIKMPGSAGAACRYETDEINLGTSGRSTFGLPTFIQDYLIQKKITFSRACFGDSTAFDFKMQKVLLYSWNFGDPASGAANYSSAAAPKHRFSGKGAYSVTLITYNCESSDTFYIQVTISDKPVFFLGNDTTLCQGSSLYLHASLPGVKYLWQDGSSQAGITVNSAGLYSLRLERNACFASDTIRVKISQPEVHIQMDYASACENTNKVRFNFLGKGDETNVRWQLSDGSEFTTKQFEHHFTGDGKKTISLRTVNAYGCVATDKTDIEIKPVINADFTLNKGEQCLDNNNFIISENIDNANPVLKRYSFLYNNQSVNNQSFNYTFPAAGNYKVYMETETNAGCRDLDSVMLNVLRSPEAAFEVTVHSYCDNNNSLSVKSVSSSVNGSIASTSFDMGDQSSFGVDQLTYSYRAAGTYRMQMRVTDAKGCSASKNRDVMIYPSPVTLFGNDMPKKCVGINGIELKNKSSISSGTIASYAWDFGDGTTSTQEKPVKDYSAEGEYQVSLISVSDKGCSSSYSSTVMAFENPVAKFEVTDLSACFNGNKLDLVNISEGRGDLNFSWNIDGFNSGQKSFNDYSFSSSGKKTIELIVTSAEGCEDKLVKSIEILPSPEASFSVTDPVQCEKTNYFIATNTSTGELKSELTAWTLNNKVFNTTDFATSIPGTGEFELFLSVTNTSGCQDVTSSKLKVMPVPAADFIAEDVCLNQEMHFVDKSITEGGYIAKTVWDFGDNSNSYSSSPSHTYQKPGKYPVYMEITSDQGCRAFVTKEVNVHENPVSSFQSGKQGYDEDKTVYVFSDLTGVAGNTYGWYMDNLQVGSGATLVKSFKDTGSHSIMLRVTTPYGCVDESTQSVFVMPPFFVHIPNAFSPNGDGDNDVFSPVTLDYFKKYEMIIFNRWGNILFQSDELNASWDGTVGGEPLSSGVFTYIILTVDLEGVERKFSGTVLLVK